MQNMKHFVDNKTFTSHFCSTLTSRLSFAICFPFQEYQGKENMLFSQELNSNPANDIASSALFLNE